MVKDIRTSRSPKSGNVTIESGDADTAIDLIAIRPSVSLSIQSLIVTYEAGGNNETTIELYDDDEGTSVGDLENRIFSASISPDEDLVLEDVELEDVNNDVIIVSTNNDGKVDVTAGGMVIEA